MTRLRALVAIAFSTVLAVTLSACAGLPTSGAVNAGDPVLDDDASSEFTLIPDGPAQDATPQEIVEGFIRAGVGPRDNWATAQQFLAADVQDEWNPQAGVTVYSPGERTLEEVSDGEFVLTVTPLGTVDTTGELVTAVHEGEIPLTFKVAQQSDGQWRITQAPDGIVLDSTQFATVFGAYSLMYFDPTWTYLVPDVRWFPRAYAATNIAQALVDGSPSPWLEGAVTTAFVDDARLAQQAVPTQSNVAEVTLQDGAAALDQVMLDRMQTQLEESLATAGIVGVDMLLAGDDQPLSAQSVAVGKIAIDARPLVVTGDGFGFVSGDVLETIAGLSDALSGVAAAEIEVGADLTAAAVRDESGAVVRVSADGTVTSLDARSGLVAPSIDPFGYVWTVPQDDPAAVVAYDGDGQGVAVADAWPEAVEVIAQRVSRDGTQVAAVVRTGDGYALWVAGIQRDRDGEPVALGDRKVLAALSGTAQELTWLDAATLAVLTTSDEDTFLYTHEVGAFGASLRAPDGSTTVAGSTLTGGVRLLDGSGELYTQRGANWQHLASDVQVLAIQQGSPR
ncbi:MAG: LpqB family beta-propeller domain-containing protein [Microbacterium sp.]